MIYMCSVILPPEGLVVVEQVTIVDIVVVVVITVNMGTGDPIIRVVTERILLFSTDPQIFPAAIFTKYFVLEVNPLIVMLLRVVIFSLVLPPSSLQSTLNHSASSTSSHCTTNDVLVMSLNLMFIGVPGGPVSYTNTTYIQVVTHLYNIKESVKYRVLYQISYYKFLSTYIKCVDKKTA